MGILEMDLPPIPIFASTQTNNYSWEKVKFLEDIGIQRVILARELSLPEINEINSKTNIELESFVHGALCVSLSGQCYFSHAIDKGSANRGACAQPCRAYYSLIDSAGNTLIKDKHLLSLKDFNLSNSLDKLLDAGISSFKIEGRLKNIEYLKNVTSHYRNQIDQALSNRDDSKKSSSGIIISDFDSDLDKTFNRGYTDYFLEKRNKNIASPNTQKSVGKFIGTVKSVHKNYFIVNSSEKLSNGDGICFFDKKETLQGTQINNIELDKIYPDNISSIEVGTKIYRNLDYKFNKQLSSSKTERKILCSINISETVQGISIFAKDEDKNEINWEYFKNKELAKNVEKAFENIQKQFSKSGDSIFKIDIVSLNLKRALFFPISELNELRRKTLELLEIERIKNHKVESHSILKNNVPFLEKTIDYKGNVSNKLAKRFYERHGANSIEPAFENQDDFTGKELMTTKHCLKFQIGACEKFEKDPEKISEPLYLKDNNRKYKLEFDCKNCLMKIKLT
jgi:putative protease